METKGTLSQEPGLKQQLVRAAGVWLLLMGAEVLHGIARTVFLVPKMGDFRARQLSVFTGSALILANTYLTIQWIGADRKTTLLLVGAKWLFFTLAFEVMLGRQVFHYSWERIASDYNLRKGGLQPIGLVFLTLAPWLMHSLRNSQRDRELMST